MQADKHNLKRVSFASDAVRVVSFRQGDHICLFYRDLEEQVSTVGPFVKVGLLRNERCLCLLPQSHAEHLLAWLEASGINCAHEVSRGALVVCDPASTYLRGGEFNREKMVEFVDHEVREALAMGFRGFRAAGDLSWAAQVAGASSQLPEYERAMDRYFPGRPALGLCMYPIELFSPSLLERIMDCHRLSLSNHHPQKRSIRIRHGRTFADVFFDRESPSLFHYTIRKEDSSGILSMGQEHTLTSALDAAESALRSSR